MNPIQEKKFSSKPVFVWICVVILFLYVLSGIVLMAFGHNIIEYKWFFGLYLALPIFFLIVHSTLVLSLSRALLFLTVAFILGFIVEWAGIQNGIIFGSRYSYTGVDFLLYGVPLIVPLYWAALSYTTYCVVNSFLKWKNIEKPSKHNKRLLRLVVLMISDCLVIGSLDLLLDPVAVALDIWQWEEAGQFQGVPVGNFFGWMLMAIMIIGGYRIFEFLRPTSHSYKSSLLIIPVLGFGILSVLLFVKALQLQLWLAAGVGGVLTFSVTIASIVYFVKWIKQKYPKEMVLKEGETNYFAKLVRELLGS